MRYQVTLSAYQLLDGAQVTVIVRGFTGDQASDVVKMLERHHTVTDLDTSTASTWCRDVLVAAIEHL